MPERKNYEDKIPFRFILDHLIDVPLMIKPMFGCHGVYANGKLCLFLMNRDRPLARRDKAAMQKGIYVATTAEHVASLKEVFPLAEFEYLKEKKVWIFVSETSREFEPYVIKACEMIGSRDAQIGR